MWLLFALGSAFFAGITAVLAKCGIRTTDSTLATAIRTVVVLLMAWIMVAVTGTASQIRAIHRSELGFILASGIATGASWQCYYRALQTGPASLVVPVDKLSILVSIGFAALVFHERLSRRSAVGLAWIVAGTGIMLL